MPIKVIDTFKAPNNSFPVVESNDIKGGYHQVSTLTDRDNIPDNFKIEGMVCFVISENKAYRLISDTWTEVLSNTLPIASDTTLGGIKVGSNLSIDASGVLSSTYSASEIKSLYESNSDTNAYTDSEKSKLASLENTSPYTLPIASDTTLGGIKVGTNLSIDASGVLSSTGTDYTHPTYLNRSVNLNADGPQVIDVVSLACDNFGHVTALNITTRDLTASDINALSTSDTIDWSKIVNAPTLGSDNILDPVADQTALNEISNPTSGSIVLVLNDGDNKPAQYAYSGTSWVKIGDVDYKVYTETDIKTLYEANDNTNAYTDAEKTKLLSLNNYTLPIADNNTLGGIKVGSNLSIDASGVLSSTYSASEIKSLYESNSNTNPFTDVDKSKLDGLENSTPYTLPIASDDTLGGIKVGSNLSIDANGVLSATASGGDSGDYNNTIGNIDLSYTINNGYHLSGLQYFTNGDVININTSNLSTYSDITINPSQLIDNLSPQEILATNLTGTSAPYSYQLSHTLNLDTNLFIDHSPNIIQAKYNNWKPGYWKNSDYTGILISTKSKTESTLDHIYGNDELKRYNFSATTDWTLWDSSKKLGPNDAMVYNGVIQRQKGNFSNYLGNDINRNYELTNQIDTLASLPQYYYTGLHEYVGFNSNQNGVYIRCVCTKDGVNEPTWTELHDSNPPLKIWISLDLLPTSAQYVEGFSPTWHNIFMPYTGIFNDGTGCSNLPTLKFTTTMPSDESGWEITFESQFTNEDTGPDTNKWGMWVKVEFPAYSKATLSELHILQNTWL